MTSAPEFLQSLAIVFCVAGVTTVVFQRLRQPVVFGYLIAGMIVGPHIPIPLVADSATIQVLSELGVILILFYLGLQFSLQKLFRVGRTAGVIALVLSSLMVWLGYSMGRIFGWTPLECFYAGALLAVSSTTIIVKTLMDQGIRARYTEVVIGICVFDDIIGIFLIAILTTLSAGTAISPGDLAMTGGRLAGFLALLLVIGMLAVPRLVRAVVRLERPETTLVASVGICFACALLARTFGYSVALGAFLGGALVAESGAGRQVERLVEPVRDVFAAVFFVSVGMLIDPLLVREYWVAIVAYTVLVVVGRTVGGTLGTFLAGYGIRSSVRTGMSLALIGEFSFIIAGLGISTGATRNFLYPIAVTVAAITTLLAPRLMRWSNPAADWIDRRLPKPLRTFAALYGSWVQQLGIGGETGTASGRNRRLVLMMLIDYALLLSVPLAVSAGRIRIAEGIASATGLSPVAARYAVTAAAVAFAGLLCLGLVRGVRYLAHSLAARAMPEAAPGKLDLAAAPRRMLVVTLQIVIVLLVGMPLLATFQPFLPRLSSPAILAAALVLLGVWFWRGAANLEGHVRAVSQVIAEALARQSTARGGEDDDAAAFRRLHEVLPGLGHVVPVRLDSASRSVGRTLAELNVGSLTGTTILVILRGEEGSLIPTGKDVLKAGDILALAGTPDAVHAARRLLLAGPGRPA